MKSRKLRDQCVSRSGRHSLPWTVSFAAAVAAACSGAPDDAGEGGGSSISGDAQNTPAEDGLADAYATFARVFGDSNLDADFRVGMTYHPGLSTERVQGAGGALMTAQVILSMNVGTVRAVLMNPPKSGDFELWFVKNQPGGTVAPETSDLSLKVGRFSSKGIERSLEVELGTDIAFDLDMLVVTRAGKKPHQSRIIVGSRTVTEKRLFRLRAGKTLDPVTGALADNIETTDPLVARGAELFFNETFGGNGRTCGTCHRADNNLTIDPAFIATLPQDDPLFVAENIPALAELEDPVLLRERGLIRENLDGFSDPTNQFVMRSVPHTLSLSLTNGIGDGFFGAPDHRLGWSGDGGPGRSTLGEFSFGAIIQHFTKTLARRPGIDFRLPTQEELDALEAFQLFTGRQKPFDFNEFFPTDPKATSGAFEFFSSGCTFCHDDLFDFSGSFNPNFDTNVRALTPDLPFDDGFGTPGDNTFNVPPLVEAADSGPFFHNNAVSTIEDAVGFYFTDTFRDSPLGFVVDSSTPVEQQLEIAAFLRVVNSFDNIEQVKKRLEYVRTVRSAGNTELLAVALADTRDARVVLQQKDLNADARAKISKAETIIKDARADKDKDRPAAMKKALKLLDEASTSLFTRERPDIGEGGSGFGGEGPIGGKAGGVGTGGVPGAGGDFGTGGIFGEGGDFGGGGIFGEGGDLGTGGVGGRF